MIHKLELYSLIKGGNIRGKTSLLFKIIVTVIVIVTATATETITMTMTMTITVECQILNLTLTTLTGPELLVKVSRPVGVL